MDLTTVAENCIVGRRFVGVHSAASTSTSPVKLKINKIVEWEWRSGVVRAASSRNLEDPMLSILVEYDDKEWYRREWARCRTRFLVLIVESDVVWLRLSVIRNPSPIRKFAFPQGVARKRGKIVKNKVEVEETKLGPNSTWPCLTFTRLIVDRSGDLHQFLKTKHFVQSLHDNTLCIADNRDIADHRSVVSTSPPCLEENPQLRLQLRERENFGKSQRVLLSTPNILIGYRTSVYRALGTTQWYTAIIGPYNEETQELTLTDDTVLEEHLEDPARLHIKVLGDEVIDRVLSGDSAGVTSRRRLSQRLQKSDLLINKKQKTKPKRQITSQEKSKPSLKKQHAIDISVEDDDVINPTSARCAKGGNSSGSKSGSRSSKSSGLFKRSLSFSGALNITQVSCKDIPSPTVVLSPIVTSASSGLQRSPASNSPSTITPKLSSPDSDLALAQTSSDQSFSSNGSECRSAKEASSSVLEGEKADSRRYNRRRLRMESGKNSEPSRGMMPWKRSAESNSAVRKVDKSVDDDNDDDDDDDVRVREKKLKKSKSDAKLASKPSSDAESDSKNDESPPSMRHPDIAKGGVRKRFLARAAAAAAAAAAISTEPSDFVGESSLALAESPPNTTDGAQEANLVVSDPVNEASEKIETRAVESSKGGRDDEEQEGKRTADEQEETTTEESTFEVDVETNDVDTHPEVESNLMTGTSQAQTTPSDFYSDIIESSAMHESSEASPLSTLAQIACDSKPITPPSASSCSTFTASTPNTQTPAVRHSQPNTYPLAIGVAEQASTSSQDTKPFVTSVSRIIERVINTSFPEKSDGETPDEVKREPVKNEPVKEEAPITIFRDPELLKKDPFTQRERALLEASKTAGRDRVGFSDERPSGSFQPALPHQPVGQLPVPVDRPTHRLVMNLIPESHQRFAEVVAQQQQQQRAVEAALLQSQQQQKAMEAAILHSHMLQAQALAVASSHLLPVASGITPSGILSTGVPAATAFPNLLAPVVINSSGNPPPGPTESGVRDIASAKADVKTAGPTRSDAEEAAMREQRLILQSLEQERIKQLEAEQKIKAEKDRLAMIDDSKGHRMPSDTQGNPRVNVEKMKKEREEKAMEMRSEQEIRERAERRAVLLESAEAAAAVQEHFNQSLLLAEQKRAALKTGDAGIAPSWPRVSPTSSHVPDRKSFESKSPRSLRSPSINPPQFTSPRHPHLSPQQLALPHPYNSQISPHHLQSPPLPQPSPPQSYASHSHASSPQSGSKLSSSLPQNQSVGRTINCAAVPALSPPIPQYQFPKQITSPSSISPRLPTPHLLLPSTSIGRPQYSGVEDRLPGATVGERKKTEATVVHHSHQLLEVCKRKGETATGSVEKNGLTKEGHLIEDLRLLRRSGNETSPYVVSDKTPSMFLRHSQSSNGVSSNVGNPPPSFHRPPYIAPTGLPPKSPTPRPSPSILSEAPQDLRVKPLKSGPAPRSSITGKSNCITSTQAAKMPHVASALFATLMTTLTTTTTTTSTMSLDSSRCVGRSHSPSKRDFKFLSDTVSSGSSDVVGHNSSSKVSSTTLVRSSISGTANPGGYLDHFKSFVESNALFNTNCPERFPSASENIGLSKTENVILGASGSYSTQIASSKSKATSSECGSSSECPTSFPSSSSLTSQTQTFLAPFVSDVHSTPSSISFVSSSDVTSLPATNISVAPQLPPDPSNPSTGNVARPLGHPKLKKAWLRRHEDEDVGKSIDASDVELKTPESSSATSDVTTITVARVTEVVGANPLANRRPCLEKSLFDSKIFDSETKNKILISKRFEQNGDEKMFSAKEKMKKQSYPRSFVPKNSGKILVELPPSINPECTGETTSTVSEYESIVSSEEHSDGTSC